MTLKLLYWAHNGPVDKQDVVYMYNRILFVFEREGNSDTCYNMDEPQCYAKWNKPVTKTHTVWFLLRGSASHQIIETESRMLVARSQGLGKWSSGVQRLRISFGEDEKVPEMDSGDGCTTMWMYLVPHRVHLKTVKMVSFTLHIFSHNKEVGNRVTVLRLLECSFVGSLPS